jgi:hypothetical protein
MYNADLYHLCKKYLILRYVRVCSYFFTLVPLSQIFCPEDGGDTILRNVGSHRSCTAPQLRKRLSSYSPMFSLLLLWLNNWPTRVTKNIIRLCVSYSGEICCYPASCTVDTGGSFVEGKAARTRSWSLTSISIWCRGQERWSYTCTLPYVSMALCVTN